MTTNGGQAWGDIRDTLDQLPAQWHGGSYRHGGSEVPGSYPLFPVRYEVTKAMQPRVVCEIGALYGYCLVTMAVAARDGGCTQPVVAWADNQILDPTSNDHCIRNLSSLGFDDLRWCMERTDLHEMAPEGADVFSVDGEHTYDDATQDIWIAMNLGARCIFVDDTKPFGDVRQAARECADEGEWHGFEVDTVNGLIVLTEDAMTHELAWEAAARWKPTPLW